MSPAYVAGVKENLGDQAVIVFDKFHVIAHVNQAVDETRKAERRQVDQADAAYLKASKWVLLKNPANHTEKQAAHYQGLLKCERRREHHQNWAV
jgi:transposase